MKNLILLTFLLFSIDSIAQRDHEFQARAGAGVSVYATEISLKYDLNGVSLSEDTTDGAATFQVPVELRYEISERFNLGIDMKFGHFLYDQSKDNSGKENHINIIGLGFEGLIVSTDKFRFYGGLGLNSGTIKITEKKMDGLVPYTETSEWRGGGFKINTGVMYFFADGPIGLNYNIGYDAHTFDLKSYTRNGANQDLTNYTGTLKVGGIEMALGVTIRIR